MLSAIRMARGAFLVLCTLMTVPQDTRAEGPYVDLAVGSLFVCAIDAVGALDCVTRSTARRLAPPADLPAFTAIDAGAFHGCGITIDGDMRCWGANDFGQLDVPEFARPVRELAIGTNTSCAIDATGSLACWGLDSNGQASPPEPDAGYVAVDVGLYHACAIRDSGEAVCWGQGEPVLPAPPPSGEFRPSVVPPEGVVFRELALGLLASCGLTAAGEIRCWGRERTGFVDGAWVLSEPLAPSEGPYVALAVLSPGAGGVCGLTVEGHIDCARPDRLSLPDAGGYVALDGKFGSPCAIEGTGDVVCAGPNLVNDRPFEQLPTALAAPQDLRAELYSTSAAELFWTDVSTAGTNLLPNAVVYEIYRDGALLASEVPGPSYFDDTLAHDITYVYTVVATHPEGPRSAPSAPITVDTSGAGGGAGSGDGYSVPARPLEPTGLIALVYSASTLELIWDRPVVPAQGYEIRRDGAFIGFTGGTSFLDTNIAPARRLRYDVIAIEADGHIGGFTTVEVDT